MKHQVISRASVEKAIEGGAKTVTAIALAHGYQKPVSGATTAKIRQVVPDVADLVVGKAVEVKIEKGIPIPPVNRSKAVSAEKPAVVVEQRKALYSGPVYGRVFEAAVQVGAEQGAKPRKDVVALVAKKTELSETQVSYALQVFTTPKHQSNQGRSRNAAGVRGQVLLVAVEG